MQEKIKLFVCPKCGGEDSSYTPMLEGKINKVKLRKGDKINFVCTYDNDDYEVTAYADDLELSVNELLVINNTALRTKRIKKVEENYYKVLCDLEDGLIVQNEYYYGLQSDLD